MKQPAVRSFFQWKWNAKIAILIEIEPQGIAVSFKIIIIIVIFEYRSALNQTHDQSNGEIWISQLP